MQYKILGKTNLKVSQIGFGAWAIGGNMWGPQDDNDSKKALNKTLDLGVNFIDTALVYGNGHSERIIGEVLKERKVERDKIYIATKIPPTIWPPGPDTHAKNIIPKEKIIFSVNESLKNLKLDYVDLIQLHSWRDNWTDESEWYETLCDLKKEGKVRFIGISVHDNLEDEVLRLIEKDKIDTVQVVYNALSQSPEKNLFPKAKKYNVGIIARVPLAYGALTGKFTKDIKFPENDFRRNKYYGAYLEEVLEKIEQFKNTVQSSEKIKLISTALQFVLNNDVVSTTIPGIRNENQAIENCSVFNEENKIKKDILSQLNDFTLQKNH